MPSGAEGMLWAWNEKNADDAIISEDDNYGCTDTFYPALINYTRSAVMSFTFRNVTKTATLIDYDWVDEAGGGEMETEAIVDIPFTIEELDAANGTENLTVELQWRYTYFFEVHWVNEAWTCVGDPPSCSCQNPGNEPLLYWDVLVQGNSSKQLVIESGNASFLLVRPVLGEQWYENNHFDTLVFSRKSVYKAEIYNGDTKVGTANIRNFTVLEDPFGAWHIFSNPVADFSNASMAGYEVAYWADPVVLEEMPFSHLYEVNYTFEGWGPYLMKVEATDFFLGKHKYEKEIFNRKVTKGGVSETGEPAGSQAYYRPGKPESAEETLSHKILPPAAMGMIILLLALGSFWYYKKWGTSR